MPTTETFFDTTFVKRLAIVNGLVPAALLAWDAYRHQLGVNDVNFAIRTTGLIGLVLITLSLVVTPLRALTGWQRLISMRRPIGVLGFLYLVAHFGIFFVFDRQASVSSTFNEVVTRRYLWFGMGALVLMAPLAITSTDAMVRRLGLRWKPLHRLAYPIAIGAAVHYYLLVKSDVRQPLAFAATIGVLLAYRFVAHYVDLRARARAISATARSAASVPTQTKRFWSGELQIVRIFDESHDVKTFRLASIDGGPLPFTHVAGQYLNLALTIDGRRVNRSYTIASSPTRNAYCEISVKRTPNGYGSHHLHDTWREGQRVKVSAPAGSFVFAGSEAQRVVLIGGGIGVTPMMSVVRSLTDRGWKGEIYFLYAVRSLRDFVFREELTYLERRFPNLHLHAVVADADADWTGARGYITADVIRDFVPPLTSGPVLLCGPGPMMDAMRQHLVGLGVPDRDIWQEVFASTPAADETGTTANAPAETLAPGEIARVTFSRAGRDIEMTGDQTLLDAAESAGLSLPFECRSGICGQCKTRLVSGRVTMDVQDALTKADRTNGLILACQAHPASDITVDA